MSIAIAKHSPFDLALFGAPHAVSSVAKPGRTLINLRELGLIAPVAGGARGYNTEGSIITKTTDGRDLNKLWDEFQETILLRNERRQTLIDFLTYPVTNLIEDVPQVGTDDFEVASEFGEPKGIRPPLRSFSLAYDYETYDIAARFTRKFLAGASASQVQSVHASVLEADNRLIFNKVMKTVFNPTNSAADINGQNFTVYKFYNNDGTTPPDYNGNTFASSHNHYLTTGNAAIDSEDIDLAYEHLRHHGYSVTNGSKVIMMVNTTEGTQIKRFRANVVNNNSKTAGNDFIPALGSAPFLLPAQGMIGSQVSAELAGLSVIGSYNNIIIIEDDYIPTGYFFMFATGGKANLSNPIGLREHVNEEMRGLLLHPGDKNGYPLINSFYERGFGTGIRQRGAGVVYQVTANASYAAPAAWA